MSFNSEFNLWFDVVELPTDPRECSLAAWNHQQLKMDMLQHDLDLMRGWEKIAKVNGEEKRKHLETIERMECDLKRTPTKPKLWDFKCKYSTGGLFFEGSGAIHAETMDQALAEIKDFAPNVEVTYISALGFIGKAQEPPQALMGM